MARSESDSDADDDAIALRSAIAAAKPARANSMVAVNGTAAISQACGLPAGPTERPTLQGVLEANISLQRACQVQIEAVERALLLSERARRRYAAVAPAAGTVEWNALKAEKGALACRLLQYRQRPTLMPCDSGDQDDQPLASVDATCREALDGAIPLRPPDREAARAWTLREREALRSGVVAFAMSATNAALLEQLKQFERNGLNNSGTGCDDLTVVDAGNGCHSSLRTDRAAAEARLAWLMQESARLAEGRASNELIVDLLQRLPRAVDWAQVSTVHVESRTPLECEVQWTQCDDPRIRPVDLSASNSSLSMQRRMNEQRFDAELAALREIVNQLGLHDWEGVAQQLALRNFPGRTPMGCHRLWRALLEPGDARSSQPRRDWTADEDDELRRAMEQANDAHDWVRVAASMNNIHTPEECRRRWTYSLQPSLKTGKWTPEEDEQLRKLVSVHGAQNWHSWVPGSMGGRSAVACRERWANRLNPSLSQGSVSDWTPEEVIALQRAVELLGNTHWAAVARQDLCLSTRGGKMCRSKWISLCKKARIDARDASEGGTAAPIPAWLADCPAADKPAAPKLSGAARRKLKRMAAMEQDPSLAQVQTALAAPLRPRSENVRVELQLRVGDGVECELRTTALAQTGSRGTLGRKKRKENHTVPVETIVVGWGTVGDGAGDEADASFQPPSETTAMLTDSAIEAGHWQQRMRQLQHESQESSDQRQQRVEAAAVDRWLFPGAWVQGWRRKQRSGTSETQTAKRNVSYSYVSPHGTVYRTLKQAIQALSVNTNQGVASVGAEDVLVDLPPAVSTAVDVDTAAMSIGNALTSASARSRRVSNGRKRSRKACASQENSQNSALVSIEASAAEWGETGLGPDDRSDATHLLHGVLTPREVEQRVLALQGLQ